jgi:hypothetical protein
MQLLAALLHWATHSAGLMDSGGVVVGELECPIKQLEWLVSYGLVGTAAVQAYRYRFKSEPAWTMKLTTHMIRSWPPLVSLLDLLAEKRILSGKLSIQSCKDWS